MPRLLTQSRFQKTMKKIIKPQSGWLDVFLASSMARSTPARRA